MKVPSVFYNANLANDIASLQKEKTKHLSARVKLMYYYSIN